MEWKLEEKLKLESNKLISVEQERDRMKAELEEMNSLVENQKASLKFKLSSQNIELQQVKEVRCGNRGTPLYTVVSSFQGVGIEGLHCMKRCFHFRGDSTVHRCPRFRGLE